MKKVIWFVKIALIATIIFISCKKEPQKYEYCKAYVYNSTRIHWGYGYFQLMVHYKFNYEGEEYKGKYKYKKKSLITSKAFEEGDSVLIKFPENNASESVIIKRIYIKNRPNSVW